MSIDNSHLIALSRAYRDGVVAGMTRFAWWKDGVEYVGTCGTTLKEAIRAVDVEHAKAIARLDPSPDRKNDLSTTGEG